jgi:hypothetical protein
MTGRARRHPAASVVSAALESSSWRTWSFPRVRVGTGEDPAQVRPALGALDEQSQMAPVGQIDLGPMDRAQAQSAGTDRELHRTRDGVVVGQGEGRISKRERGSDQFVGQRRAIQE